MDAVNWLLLESSAMQQKLARVPTFASTIPMVRNAVPPQKAVEQADRIVQLSRSRLLTQLQEISQRLRSEAHLPGSISGLHRRYLLTKLRFDALLTAVDIFADALTQRAEHGIGVLLRGLDHLAEDSLRTKGELFQIPPLVCYLERGLGGAIRRAFTPLPGGETNRVALIQVPRERLCGPGLASLIHEAGHQGLALLSLTPAYASALRAAAQRGQLPQEVAQWWCTKLNEALCDLWACSKLGPTATIGLFGVMGLTPPFVFHDSPDDPHPMPWFRALLSAAFGAAILPHPIWQDLSRTWRSLYPPSTAPPQAQRLIATLLPSLPQVVNILAQHRPKQLRGLTLSEALDSQRVHPNRLLPKTSNVRTHIENIRTQYSPCEFIATIGLARYAGRIGAAEQDGMIRGMLVGATVRQTASGQS